MRTKTIHMILMILIAAVAVGALVSVPMAFAAEYSDDTYANELLYGSTDSSGRPWDSNVIGESAGLTSGNMPGESEDLVTRLQNVASTILTAFVLFAVVVAAGRLSTRAIMELMGVDDIPMLFLTSKERGGKEPDHENWVKQMIWETFLFLLIAGLVFTITGIVIGIAFYAMSNISAQMGMNDIGN